MSNVNKLYVIGIDPGMSGGIAGISNGRIVDICSMPRCPKDLLNTFIYFGFPNVKGHIFIENVHSMPTDGVVGAFTFGKGLGWLEGVLAAMGAPEPLKVNPKEWQRSYNMAKLEGEKKEEYKRRLKEKALKLSKNDKRITLKTCDAYLIALYGYNKLKEDPDSICPNCSTEITPAGCNCES